MPKKTERQRKGASGCVALTGATGFVGQAVMAALVERGVSIRALTRKPVARDDAAANVTWIHGDLSDMVALTELVAGAETLIHVAGATKALSSDDFHRVNTMGTFHMAALARAAGVKHFVLISSLAAQLPVLSPYAASKASGEYGAALFRQDMRVSIVRPPAVLGPKDPMLAPMFGLIRKGILPVPGEARGRLRVFSVVSASDLARSIVEMVQAPSTDAQWIEPHSVARVTWEDVRRGAENVLARRVWRIPLPPILLLGIAVAADAFAGLIRRTLPLSAGKVRELLIPDWTSKTPVPNAMSLQEILTECLVEPAQKNDPEQISA